MFLSIKMYFLHCKPVSTPSFWLKTFDNVQRISGGQLCPGHFWHLDTSWKRLDVCISAFLIHNPPLGSHYEASVHKCHKLLFVYYICVHQLTGNYSVIRWRQWYCWKKSWKIKSVQSVFKSVLSFFLHIFHIEALCVCIIYLLIV